MNQAPDGTLTWYLQTYHTTAEAACVNDAPQSGLIINGVQYPIQQVFSGDISLLSPNIFGVGNCSGRGAYGVIVTPFLGTTLSVTPYSNVACWANCGVQANGNFNPPPPPVCTTCPITGFSTSVSCDDNGTGCTSADDNYTYSLTVNHLVCGTVTGDGQFTVVLDPGGANTVLGPFNYTAGNSTTVVLPPGTANGTAVQIVDNDFPCDFSGTISVDPQLLMGCSIDNIAPVYINCPNSFIISNAVDLCGGAVNWSMPLATDECGVVSNVRTDAGPVQGTIWPVGMYTVTYVAMDAAGNIAQCNFNITVTDSQNPELLCPTNTVEVETDPGVCTWLSDAQIAPSVNTDNCPYTLTYEISGATTVPPGTLGSAEGQVLNQGTNTICYTITEDGNGMMVSNCCFNVEVEDEEAPVITCPADIMMDAEPGICAAVVNFDDPEVTDNCALPTTSGLETFVYTGATQSWVVPAGVTEITIDAWGAQGGGSEYCGGALFDDGGLGGYATGVLAVVPGSTIYINVGEYPGLNTSPNYGVIFPGGWNGGGDGGKYGAAGGGASDIRIGGITLNDRVIVAGGGGGGNTGCPDHGTGGAGGGLTGDPGINLSGGYTPGGGGTPVAGGSAGTSGTSGSQGQGGANSGDPYHVAGGGGGWYGGGGAYAAGGGGGSSYLGSLSLASTTPGVRVGHGEIQITYNTTTLLTQTGGLPSGSSYPLGTTVNTFVATDASGNTASCSFSVTILDLEDPMVTCPANAVITTSNLGTTGDCAGQFAWTHPLPTDNCSVDEYAMTYTNPDGTIDGPLDVELVSSLVIGNNANRNFYKGTTTVTYYVVDAAGHTATCSFTVTVTDDEDPTFVNCPEGVTYTVGLFPGACTGGAIWSIPIADDNCSAVVTQTNGPAQGTILTVGTYPIQYTATDAANNTATCNFTINVIDTQDPVIVCPGNMIISETDPGVCSWTSPVGSLTPLLVSSNCAATVAWQVENPDATMASGADDVSGYTFAAGTSTVTYTITETASGQSWSCSFTVTVEDEEAPVITCPADIMMDTEPGICAAVVNFDDPEVTDNCTLPTTSGIETFVYTGAAQSWVVPAGVTEITIDAWGAQGGPSESCTGGPDPEDDGGLGGYATGKLAVTPGQVLNIYVGQKPINGNGNEPGGFNGGGAGGQWAGAGGGASDIRVGGITLGNRVIVAGGGGGGNTGCPNHGTGGDGGGLSGNSGINLSGGFTPGGGGSQASGGSAGTYGASGSLGQGGAYGGGSPFGSNYHVAGGGGGWYGGGGAFAAGGGGGSSYLGSLSLASTTPGVRVGHGEIQITYNTTTLLTQTGGLPSGSSYPLGTTVNTFVATDASGNTASCSFSVTILDLEDPMVTCPSNAVITTSNLGTTGDCAGQFAWTHPLPTDNCSVDEYAMTYTNPDGTIDGPLNVELVSSLVIGNNANRNFYKGTTTVTYYVVDAAGHSANCSFTVTVTDDEDPTFVNCPEGVTYTVGLFPGGCTGGAIWSVPIADDNCSAVVTQTNGPAQGTILTVGTYPIQYTATDAANNTATCNFAIEVIDTQDPVIVCPGNVVIGETDPGVCSWTAPAGSLTPLLANSNCPATVSWLVENPDASTASGADDVSGYTFALGTSTVTYTITETASGQSWSCSFTVTVEDHEAPTIVCPGDISVNNDPGICGAVVPFDDPAVSDNCTIVFPTTGAIDFPYTGGLQTFIVPAGVTSIEVTSKGAQGGNSGGLGASMTGTFNVTPGEVLNIFVGGQGTFASNNNGGGGGGTFVWQNTGTVLIQAAGGGGGRSGNSNISLGGPGSNTLIPTASINGSGNGAAGAAGNGGVGGIVLQNFISYPGAGGGGAGWLSDGLSGTGATYNATGGTTPISGGIGGTGFNPCEGVNVVGGYGGGGGGGGCSGASGGGGGYNGGGGGNGWNGGSWGSGGGGGSYNGGSNSVNLAGVNSGNGLVSITYNVVGMASLVQTSGLPSGDLFPVGTTANTFVITDNSGNTASCSFTVTVNDTESPVLDCPADVEITTSNEGTTGDCAGQYSWNHPIPTDNCSIIDFDFTYTNPDLSVDGPFDGSQISSSMMLESANHNFQTGVSTITYYAVDAAGHTATCSFTVTVTDDEDPTFVNCPEGVTYTVGLFPDNCTGGAIWSVPIADDNCSAVVTQTAGPLQGTILTVGTYNLQYTATDAAMNTATCNFTIEVIDTEEPVIVCPGNVVIDETDPGVCSWTAPAGSLTPLLANSNCPANVTWEVENPDATTASGADDVSGYTFALGTSTVTYTITETASGQSWSCSFTVTVEDHEAPVIECPADIAVVNDLGECGAIVEFDDPEVTDNCPLNLVPGMATFLFSESPETWTVPAGVTTITAEVCGGQGGSVYGGKGACLTVDLAVTPGQVLDLYVGSRGGALNTFCMPGSGGEASYISLGGAPLVVAAGGGGGVVCSQLYGGPGNDGLLTTPGDRTNNSYGWGSNGAGGTGGGAGAGAWGTGGSGGWFTAGANGGGSAGGAATGRASGYSTFDFAAGSGGGYNGAGGADMDSGWGTASGRGGGSYYSGSLVASMAGVQELNGQITISYGVNALVQTTGLPSGSLFPVGTTINTFVATDASGNTASCSFAVTVTDDEDPAIACPANAVITTSNLGTLGDCAGQLDWTHPDPTDNCGVDQYVVTYTNPDGTIDGPYDLGLLPNMVIPGDASRHFEVGVSTVNYYVQDIHGNTTACAFTVTVTDDEDPAFVNCPEGVTYTVGLFPDNCTGGAIWSVPIAEDNCSAVVTQTNGPIQGTILTVGTYQIQYTATDAANNTASCNFAINVIDTQDPVIVCPGNVVINQTDPGVCTWTAPAGSLTPLLANSNCPANVTWEVENPDASTASGADDVSGYTFALGTSTVTYTITETASGQSWSCSFTVTVEDNEAPVIECPADIAVVNDLGECGAVVEFDDPEVTDNCGVILGTPVPASFEYTGAEQTWTVPAGVTSIMVDMSGAAGGEANLAGNPGNGSGREGYGGRVVGTIPVTPGDVIYINVGGKGNIGAGGAGGTGGFNGGGTAGSGFGFYGGGGGGGASDIRIGGNTLADRKMIAGAGGGESYDCANEFGGDGGGVLAIAGTWCGNLDIRGGGGGSQVAGGVGGVYPNNYLPGFPGVLGIGGNAGSDGSGGGGGGGFYGGGGGAWGGGGGGSSYTDPLVTDVFHTQGFQPNAGVVTIMYNQQGGLMQVAGLPSGSLFPVGTTTNVFVATDGAGNTASCSFAVTVTDNENPVVGCPANANITTSNLGTLGDCAGQFAWTHPTPTDNCGIDDMDYTYTNPDGTIDGPFDGEQIASMNISSSANHNFAVGTTTVSYYVIDIHGNTTTCAFTVTVTDDEDPTFVNCPEGVTYTVGLFPDNCTGGAIWSVPIAGDNCSAVVTQTAGPLQGTILTVGTYPIQYTATDAANNTATCNFTIEVIDTEDPIIVCPGNVVIDETDPGVCSWTAPAGSLTPLLVNSNCPATVTWVVENPDASTTNGVNDVSGYTFELGTSTVTYTITETASGQSWSCSFTVTVEDHEAPLIECPADIAVVNDLGECGAVVEFSDPEVSDNCTLPSGPSGQQMFNFTGTIETWTVPAGVTSIQVETWGAQGGNESWNPQFNGGKGAYMSGEIAVTPGEVLQILVGGQGETGSVGGGGGGTYIVRAGNVPLLVAGGGGGASSDQDGVAAVTGINGTADGLGAGSGGANGNGGTVCGLNQNDGGGGGGFITDGQDARTTGNGGFGGKSFLNGGAGGLDGRADGACFADAKGGFGGGGGTSCNTVGGGGGGGYSGGAGGQHFNNCVTGVVPRAGGGGGGSYNIGSNQNNIAGVQTGNGMVLITYAAPASALMQTAGLPSGSQFPVGTTTNTFVATDASGNTASCQFNVTVSDTEAPAISCPQNVNITTSNLGTTGDCDGQFAWSHPLPTDNCGFLGSEYNVAFINPDGTIEGPNLVNHSTATNIPEPGNRQFGLGTTTINYFVVDIHGNTNTCAFTITVTDDEDPAFVNCPEGVTYTVGLFPDNCTGGAIWSVPIAEDNCSAVVTQTAGPLQGTILTVGTYQYNTPQQMRRIIRLLATSRSR
ncbi:MAG: HYR domain-containing protein [Lewinellaceae bacterium]|nr:HYR domain-containing protein [Lewinellaceae bacterium]